MRNVIAWQRTRKALDVAEHDVLDELDAIWYHRRLGTKKYRSIVIEEHLEVRLWILSLSPRMFGFLDLSSMWCVSSL